MSAFNQVIRRLARAETPFLRFAKRCIKFVIYPTVPVLPRWILPPLRAMYEFHYLVIIVFRSLRTVFYYNPLLQARCASFGKNVSIDGMVFVSGPTEIHLGNNTKLGGKISIISGSVFERPQFILKDGSAIGWNGNITVNKEIVVEEDVIVSYNCSISDSDGHPREADLRAAGKGPTAADVRPVRICRYAWIGNGSYIMKGVTVGEGAIIGANSVVITNIPPYSLAMGNPAEVIMKNVGLPSTAKRKKLEQMAENPPSDATASTES